ncbi:teashirt homolog 1-like [Ptychodera flava]|uniref:teashirt homolog 1-like n=1 Tax=Ptychodera flava TaxID=63121 RepID=UPI00396A03F6
MPRRKQQAPKRLKTGNDVEQDDELDEEKLEDEDYDVSMETEETEDDDAEYYAANYEYERKEHMRRSAKDREEIRKGNTQEPSEVQSEFSENDDSPLNLSNTSTVGSMSTPTHMLHYLPNLPPTSSFKLDDDAVAQAAAVAESAAASIAMTAEEEGCSLSAAHATWVKSVQEMMSSEGTGPEHVFGCLECNRRFVSNDALMTHLQETGHITGRPLDPMVNDVSTCKGYDLCIGPNGQLFSKCFLRRHQKRTTESDVNVCNLRCRQCSKSFPNLLNLTLHMKQSGHFNPNKANRKKKSKTHHLDYEEEIQVDKVMKCMVCHKSFDNLQDLTMHMMETQHFSRVPGYKTETLLQQHQDQLQNQDAADDDPREALMAEQREEAWRNVHDSRGRVVVSDPPVIAAARAQQVASGSASGKNKGAVSHSRASHHSTMQELPSSVPNDSKLQTVRARLQNKMSNSRVLKCLACDHSFDNIHSLTKHMTQTGHYQKAAEDSHLLSSSASGRPNGNMMKWEVISAVPTNNGMYTHVKSRIISHPRNSQLTAESHRDDRESPGPTPSAPKANNTFPLRPSQNSTSEQSKEEPHKKLASNMSTRDKYINPDNFDLGMSSQRVQFNPLGNLEALVHGASTGKFPSRTNNSHAVSRALPERMHTVHWTSSGLSPDERYEGLRQRKSTSHVTQFSMLRKGHGDESRSHLDFMRSQMHDVKDEQPLDFSIPKHRGNQETSNNSNPNSPRAATSSRVKQEQAEMDCQDEPLALTVKKESKDGVDFTEKSSSEYQGPSKKIKTESLEKCNASLHRRSLRVHNLKSKIVKQDFGSAASPKSSVDGDVQRNEGLCQGRGVTAEVGNSEHASSGDENDIPKNGGNSRSLYQPVNQNGYLATTKGGVLPMATGTYEDEGDDPLKAMDKLVQSAVVGRQIRDGRKSDKNGSNSVENHEREHDCGLKIAMYGPIMGNDDMGSNPLEEMDKLVNAAL